MLSSEQLGRQNGKPASNRRLVFAVAAAGTAAPPLSPSTACCKHSGPPTPLQQQPRLSSKYLACHHPAPGAGAGASPLATGSHLLPQLPAASPQPPSDLSRLPPQLMKMHSRCLLAAHHPAAFDGAAATSLIQVPAPSPEPPSEAATAAAEQSPQQLSCPQHPAAGAGTSAGANAAGCPGLFSSMCLPQALSPPEPFEGSSGGY